MQVSYQTFSMRNRTPLKISPNITHILKMSLKISAERNFKYWKNLENSFTILTGVIKSFMNFIEFTALCLKMFFVRGIRNTHWKTTTRTQKERKENGTCKKLSWTHRVRFC